MALNNNYNTTSKETALHAADYLQIIRNRWKEIFLTFLLVFMAVAVVTYLLPPTYKTTAQFQINQPKSIIGSDDIVERGFITRNFLTTQFEVVSAPETLKLVVEKLKLEQEFGVNSVDAAIVRLKSMIEVQPIRNTDLVDVIVYGPDPNQVQSIAAGIVDAYSKRREMEEEAYTLNALSKLSKSLQARDDEARARNAEYRQKIAQHGYFGPGIWTDDPSVNAKTMSNEEAELTAIQQNLYKLSKDVSELESHINEIKKLPNEQLLEYVVSSDLLNNELFSPAILRQLNAEYKEKKAEREALLGSGLGPKHHKVVTVDAAIQKYEKDLENNLSGLRGSLEGKLAMIKASYAKEKEREAEIKLELKNKTLIDDEISSAKRAFSIALERARKLDDRYTNELASFSIPKIPIVVQGFPPLPQSPVSPKVALYLGVGALAGLILGFIVAFILEYFDTSVKTVEEVERALEVPVIGVIPKDIGILYDQPSESPDVEAYRILRTNIELAKKGINEVSLAFISGTAGEGKTTTLCNLAFVYAQAGYTTLMIDADMRRSKLHEHLNLENSYGLSNYLTSEVSIEDVVMETAMENLFILPSGPTPRDPSGLLSSRKMAELVREAKSRFDVVLIDSPPILGISDSSIIVRLVDMTVMVIQPKKLAEKILKKEKEVIASSGGNLIGTVMNNVDIGSDHQYQYYTTYYMYTPGQSPKKKVKSSTDAKHQASKQSDRNLSHADEIEDDQEDLY